MGKSPFSFSRKSARRRTKRPGETSSSPIQPAAMIEGAPNNSISAMVSMSKTKKKAGGARLWMRFDRSGQSELIECDKSIIIKRTSIPPRDLRILGPVFSQSSHILAREKAMVVNLEFIKAIITAEEVLLLDPLRHEVLPFVDQLRQQLPHRSSFKANGSGQIADSKKHIPTSGQWLPVPEAVEGLQAELPFEFQVLEIALEVVCTYLDTNVAELERDAYPVLDELARNVSTKNLEHVRSLKSNLTRLLARVQKVRDEIEHLLDDNEDMEQLYLTRNWIQNQQFEALPGAAATNSITTAAPHLHRLGSNRTLIALIQLLFVERVKLEQRPEEREMSPEMAKNLSESDAGDLNLKETELTLGIPGGSRGSNSGTKRVFSETVDLKIGIINSVVTANKNFKDDEESENESKSPVSKAQVVGWPPVKGYRKSLMKSCKYVKVAVDGTPYLRKVDLEMYNSYQQLLNALENMFTCLSIRNVLNERKIMDTISGTEYVPTYEDKDGDWMLVGDVPWKMFVESCKRLRLVKSSDATGLAPRTPEKCSSSCC